MTAPVPPAHASSDLSSSGAERRNLGPDRLYELLPLVYRQRDEEQGGLALKALLRAIAEQVDVVEEDLNRLYDNWFIETCDDWVVPYIGDLVGYRQVHEAGEPSEIRTAAGRQRNKILIPRREVANTVAYRRRKGALALLELLAFDVAGWPARAVEIYRLLAWTQMLNSRQPDRGGFADLRSTADLRRLDGPFDRLAHTVDVRRISSSRTPGRHNIPAVALFVWRLRTWTVTGTEAAQLGEGSFRFAFSALGNETPLFARATAETDPNPIAEEQNLPVRIDRRMLGARRDELYGPDRSLQICRVMAYRPASDPAPPPADREPVPAADIVAADLGDWQYRPEPGTVAVDPQLGRIAFPPSEIPAGGVWVSYRYGFSADIGGGEYPRPISEPAGAHIYRVGQRGYATLTDALAAWSSNDDEHAVVEILESGVITEPIDVTLGRNRRQTLQLRAAQGARPVLRLLNWRLSRSDAIRVEGLNGSRFTLDGLVVEGEGLHVRGDLTEVAIRHCTLVPGWGLRHSGCLPVEPEQASLLLEKTSARVVVEHSVIGSIQVNQNERAAEPLNVCILDSVLDATDTELEALGAPGWPSAHVVLTMLRSTVIGRVEVRALELAENSIFDGVLTVRRRQRGCVRFCYVTPGSRTPRRHGCQPDLAEAAAGPDEQDQSAAADRVRPRFASQRYGDPDYCRLAVRCAEEIVRGADDESEMGVFHDLYDPQRLANLRARLEEYTPAGSDAGIIFAT
jgi:hypothetical protein